MNVLRKSETLSTGMVRLIGTCHTIKGLEYSPEEMLTIYCADDTMITFNKGEASALCINLQRALQGFPTSVDNSLFEGT